MKTHPYAELCPPMTADELDALVTDIKEHGLLEPIVVFEDMILDGRHRFEACRRSKIKPRFAPYKGNGAMEYVVSKNVKRRHLTPTQLAMVASDLEKQIASRAGRREDPNGNSSRDLAAKTVGVGTRTIQRVQRIEQEAPDLLPKLRSGDLTATEADEQIRQRTNQQRRVQLRQESDRIRVAKPVAAMFRELKQTARLAEGRWLTVAQGGSISPEAARFGEKRVRDLIQVLDRLAAKLQRRGES